MDGAKRHEPQQEQSDAQNQQASFAVSPEHREHDAEEPDHDRNLYQDAGVGSRKE